MKKYGGVIVNIIADMWKGFPGMRLEFHTLLHNSYVYFLYVETIRFLSIAATQEQPGQH